MIRSSIEKDNRSWLEIHSQDCLYGRSMVLTAGREIDDA